LWYSLYAEATSVIAVNASLLYSVLRSMIESGALIQSYVDTDIELQDAELLIAANDQNSKNTAQQST